MSKVKKISENIVEIDGERFVKEDSRGWLDIPELKFSVEIEVHDKDKSFSVYLYNILTYFFHF